MRSRAGVIAACSFVGVLVLAAAAVLAAQMSPSSRPAAKPSHTHARWLISSKALAQLRNAGASSSLIDKAFGNGSSFIIDNSGSPAIGVPVATYGSYGAIQQALSSGVLPGRYRAVIYDNEAWRYTPAAEQHDPAKYEHLVAQLLHAHGLLYIAAPAVDLVTVLNRETPGTGQLRAYLLDSIAADAARYADVIDIQAQRAEAATSEYASFVDSAAAQARKANPRVTVLAGLRSVRWVTPLELHAAYSSVSSVVDGFWLNIPGAGGQCASCGVPDPEPALAMLRQIYG